MIDVCTKCGASHQELELVSVQMKLPYNELLDTYIPYDEHSRKCGSNWAWIKQ